MPKYSVNSKESFVCWRKRLGWSLLFWSDITAWGVGPPVLAQPPLPGSRVLACAGFYLLVPSPSANPSAPLALVASHVRWWRQFRSLWRGFGRVGWSFTPLQLWCSESCPFPDGHSEIPDTQLSLFGTRESCALDLPLSLQLRHIHASSGMGSLLSLRGNLIWGSSLIRKISIRSSWMEILLVANKWSWFYPTSDWPRNGFQMKCQNCFVQRLILRKQVVGSYYFKDRTHVGILILIFLMEFAVYVYISCF